MVSRPISQATYGAGRRGKQGKVVQSCRGPEDHMKPLWAATVSGNENPRMVSRPINRATEGARQRDRNREDNRTNRCHT